MEKKNLKEGYKIVMTGGHAASSAYVVMEEIKRQGKPWDIYWIGFKRSFEGAKSSTLSSIYFPKYGIKTYDLITGRIQRKLTLYTIPAILKIPVGFVHAGLILAKIKPSLILSFGGFAAFPVVVVGYLMGIPVIIHEQTSVVGRANKFSAPFAKKIAISRETSREYFPREKTVLTGNPVGRDIVDDKQRDLSKDPSILVTGGQSGSRAINAVVGEVLTEILELGRVVHLTGLGEEERFKRLKEELDEKIRERYLPYGVVDPREYNRLFNAASLVISRAGANTVSKIIASGKPAILIPLPISYLEEQQKNAIFAHDFAGSRVLEQDDLSGSKLVSEVKAMIKKYRVYRNKKFVRDNPDIDASRKLVGLIEENLR